MWLLLNLSTRGRTGDVTSVTFPSDKYLVTTSADGTLLLFRTKDWSMLRKFKGHKVCTIKGSGVSVFTAHAALI